MHMYHRLYTTCLNYKMYTKLLLCINIGYTDIGCSTSTSGISDLCILLVSSINR